ncbi:gamma-glutamylcyclotransferase family protein [Allorhodopirellula solitaria]|uniref:AIG2-like family protein n=1 Tax=Allorhodopirellula solitaria TaxID=2527987 RepID=A0A5C5XQ06_9BACT|nr:gamma-glutamylcyclotransferase family protein [Allorhodopirellula solitaria]TWT64974.1 AIG2-like family protein [Allorhodopirellula solitaria]
MAENPDFASIDRFFVYGTLCRGQCRERCWPCQPLVVTPAWTWDKLYGRADYPAMRPGTDRVIGECWRFASDDLPRVRSVLDQIEVTGQPGVPNLYDPVVVEVYDLRSIQQEAISSAHCIGSAHAYHYSTPPEQDGFAWITPQNGQGVRWPA